MENASYKKVNATIEQLQALPENYGIQVNPREINYFYLIDGVRERILEQDGKFYVNDTKIEFSQEEILAELEELSGTFFAKCDYETFVSRSNFAQSVLYRRRWGIGLLVGIESYV